MFAPKVAKPQAKVPESQTHKLAPQRPTLVARPLGGSAVEQARMLQRSIGNQATLRLLLQQGLSPTGKELGGHPKQEAALENMMARGAPRGVAWDFSTIPVFAPDRADYSLLSVLQSSSPGTSATAKAIHQAAVENGTAAPLTPAALSATMAQVRMRDDASADRSARLLRAEALAFGNQILFRHGRYDPASELGRALIAHEITHVAHQRETGRVRPQRLVSGNVLSESFTRAMAEAMTDAELTQQINILRSHLQEAPDDAGTAGNLALLESVAYQRQGTAGELRRSQPAPWQPVPADAIASMTATDKLIKAYEYASIGSELRSQLEQRFGPKQLVIMIGAGIGVFIAAQFTPVGWIADIGIVLTAAFMEKALFDVFHHLAGFAAAADATTDAQLHQAGDEFAKAVAGLAIDTVLLILTLLSGGAGGAAGRATSSASVPARELALVPARELALVGAEGVVVGTIPAVEAAEMATAITTAQAAQLGLKGAALANAMMSQGAGPQTTSESVEGSGGPPSQGAQTAQDVISGGTAELVQGKSGLGQYGIDKYGAFSNRPQDKLAGHELLQNAWLEVKGFGKRLTSKESRENPAVALTQPEHTAVGREQIKMGLFDQQKLAQMSAKQNIEANVEAMRRAKIPNYVIETFKKEALKYAETLKLPTGGTP